MTDTLLFNGHMEKLDSARPSASAVAIAGRTFTAVGIDREIMARREAKTTATDL